MDGVHNFDVSPDGIGPQTVKPLLDEHVDLWSSNPVKDHCFRIKPTSDPRLLELVIELREGKRTSTGRLDVADIIANMDEQMREEAFCSFRTSAF